MPLKKKKSLFIAGLLSVCAITLSLCLQSFNGAFGHRWPTGAGCDSIPPLNQLILDFAKSKLNHKVGAGECWDLAAEALNASGAKWDNDMEFGRKLNLEKECVYAGDIIQFNKVRIEYRENNTLYHESLPQHTAIIFEVSDQSTFTLIEQNTGRLGQKVGVSPLDLRNIKSGKFKIYRPVN